MHDSSRHQGLSAAEAASRLARDGPNALPTDKQRLLAILLESIQEPMFLLLVAAAMLYLALGDLHEGLLLLFMVSLTIGLTLYQAGKTERALGALRDLSSPHALVLRNGTASRIPARDVVRGDLLLLSEGDRVAADARLIEVNSLQLDESLLTGEAWPVSKRIDAMKDQIARPGGDDSSFVWSGTLVVRGDGIACVTATGPYSELGRIGGALQHLSTEPSLLQRQTAHAVKVMAISGVILSLLVTVLHGILHGAWLQAALRGIHLGRRIFANMQNAMSYVLAMHVPIAGMALLPAFLGWPILLYPMQIAFLELIIDPACSLAFENQAAADDAMRRPPRGSGTSLWGKKVILPAMLQGGIACLAVGLSYFWAFEHLPPAEARALAFTVLVTVNLALIFSTLARNGSPAPSLRSTNWIPLLIAGLAGIALLATFYIPALATAFGFSPLTATDFAMALVFGLPCALGYEWIKLATRHH